MKRGIIELCLLALLATVPVSCSRHAQNSDHTANVCLATVGAADAAEGNRYPGRVVASSEVNMAFKIDGRLQRVAVDEGDYVKAGQLIAQLDDHDYLVQLDAVEAEYNSVKAEAERVMALYADSVTTADAYDKARYGLQQITAKYEHARDQLADTRIYAPFNGRVQSRYYDAPSVIGAGMPVGSIVSESTPEVEINIPASVYMRRSEISRFDATFDVIANRKVRLMLIGIAPKANANQLYTVRLAVPPLMQPLPAAGMNAMVEITFASQAESIVIPSSALLCSGNDASVWVFSSRDSTVHRRVVAVERLHTDGTAVIGSGLAGGEQIVVSGVNKLTDGLKVRVLEQDSETNVGGLL